jgi:hypothetical protein
MPAAEAEEFYQRCGVRKTRHERLPGFINRAANYAADHEPAHIRKYRKIVCRDISFRDDTDYKGQGNIGTEWQDDESHSNK